MGACSFDWELASKFIPVITGIIAIGVAIFVYWAWHKQKGKEVVANEAKAYLIKLAELQNLQSKIYKHEKENNSYEYDKESFICFKKIKDEISGSAIFLDEALKSDTQFSHDSTTVLSQAILFIDDFNEYLNGTKELESIRMIDSDDARKLTDQLRDHSIYKKIF